MDPYLVWLGRLALVAFAAATVGHALIYKRDVRSTIAWTGLIVLVPLFGASLYWLLGVNRIERKALRLRRPIHGGGDLRGPRAAVPERFASLVTVGNRITQFPLIHGNAIEPLVDGDEAYPAMLAAIETARASITLAMYIFDADDVGERFQAALAAAQRRGVEVRVLIDAVGGYQWLRHDMAERLHEAQVPVAEFLPVSNLRRLFAFNLRNHRKLLIVDGVRVFTGGMNITGEPLRDLHFRLSGPVAGHLQQVFADDWQFATGEALAGTRWFPQQHETGAVLARALPDGPDVHFDVLRLLLLGAIAEARTSICILTPYFLPDSALVAALNTAALRGVDVAIVLPERGDSALITWAMHAGLWQVLERGCRVWFSPPPFDHSKLVIVDGGWVLIGSSNWDPRSLRLNFELNVECFDAELAERLGVLFETRRNAAREVAKSELDGRSLPIKLRDGAARLLTPYL